MRLIRTCPGIPTPRPWYTWGTGTCSGARKRRPTRVTNPHISCWQIAGEYREVIEELFGKPQNLPALRLPLPEIDDKLEEEKTTTVLASFDVSSTGRAKNVHIIESEPADATSARRKAKKTIRGRIYRPRFENGEPVATVGNKIRIID